MSNINVIKCDSITYGLDEQVTGTGKGKLSDNYYKRSDLFKQRHGEFHVKAIIKGID